MKPTQLDAVAAWALAALKGTAQHKTLRGKLDKQKPPSLFTHFKLDGLERRILELAWAVERRFAVAETARARGGLTVERLRELLDDDGVDAALSLKRPLRRHALVTTGGGAIAATDLVRLAPGLAARLDGKPEPDALWPGLARLVPGARGDVPQRVTQVLEELDARVATLLTLDGCARREAHELASGLARRAGRGVLLVDGELVATAPSPWLIMSAARREADLDGDALLVCQSAALGEAWRALLVPVTGETVPLLILADAAHTPDPLPAPCLVRRLSLHAPAPSVAASAPAPEPLVERPSTIDDGLDHVRQMAIRDAERALGIFRPPPPAKAVAPPPSAPKPSPPPQQAQPQPPPPQPAPPPATAKPRADEPPPSLPADERRGELPEDRAEARAIMMRRREAAKREREARERAAARGEKPAEPSASGDPAATANATPASSDAATTNAGAATTNAGATTANAGAATGATPASPPPDGPPMALPAEPALEDLVRACSTSPSSAQRIEIIGKLRGLKHAAVVAAVRHNAASAHPGVRAAAEQAMAALFGPNWNVSRPVAKPVQAPPSDDKDRGPPGGW